MRPHIPHNGKSTRKKDDLHDGIVERNVAGKDVKVSAYEDNCIKFLCFERDTSTRLSGVDFEKQNQDTEQVHHVARKSENVHGARRRSCRGS